MHRIPRVGGSGVLPLQICVLGFAFQASSTSWLLAFQLREAPTWINHTSSDLHSNPCRSSQRVHRSLYAFLGVIELLLPFPLHVSLSLLEIMCSSLRNFLFLTFAPRSNRMRRDDPRNVFWHI